MSTTYDVRIWKTKVYEGKRGNTHYVRWSVAGKEWKEPFKTKALSESFRSDLVAAARKGEAFDVDSGRPISMQRDERDMSWYEFACKWADMKWPNVAATTRRTHAEALTAITIAMLATGRGKPDDKLMRRALGRWAFNTVKRDASDCPDDVRTALRWVKAHTRPVSAFSKPEVLRPLLNSISVRLDGKPGAPSVTSRRRKILNNAVEYAAELKLLSNNPIPTLKWKAPKAVQVVDPRCVPNPIQVRTLLEGVREEGRVGRRLVAFFGCLYFAGMRPEEAAHLNKSNLALPDEGWGEFHLDGAEPHAGKEWTDSGRNRDRRQLKQRERGESRIAPCPPELTALIHAHLDEFGTTPDGRLFVGDRNHNELPKLTVVRVWKRARDATFTSQVAASPLARRPVRPSARSGVDVAQWGSAAHRRRRVGRSVNGGTVQNLCKMPRRQQGRKASSRTSRSRSPVRSIAYKLDLLPCLSLDVWTVGGPPSGVVRLGELRSGLTWRLPCDPRLQRQSGHA